MKLTKNKTQTKQKIDNIIKPYIVCCIIFGFSLFLWGCYEINYCVASKMKWFELLLGAVAMICPILIIHGMFSLAMGRILFTEIEITYD